MATRKRNEWLDAGESDEEVRGYDSEDESRARMLRSKRQKVEHDSADDIDGESFGEDENSDGFAEEDEDEDEDKRTTNVPSSSLDKRAELARLEKLAASLPSDIKLRSKEPLPLPTKSTKDKSGVIYLSSVPPFMKPSVLRSLLSPYGSVGRVFLTPESTANRQKRLKSGGTRRKLFLDGWVEFLSKKDAKFVAENLNAQTMGGKKRGRWHDEVWNIRYLSGVKWTHLVEQIQNENAERAARLRMEIAKDTKENKRFLDNMEKAKMIGGIEAKRKKKLGDNEEDQQVEERAEVEEKPQKPENKRRRLEFRQNEVRLKGQKKPEPGQDITSVLSKMF